MAHIEAVGRLDAPRRRALGGPCSLGAFAAADTLALALLTLLAALVLTDAGDRTAHFLIMAGLSAGVLIWLRSQGHYRVRQSPSNHVRPLLQAAVAGFLIASTACAALDRTSMLPACAGAWALAAPLMLTLRLAARAALNAAGVWMQPVTLIAPRAGWEDGGRLLGGNAGPGLEVERFIDLTPLDHFSREPLAERLRALDGQTLFIAPDERTQPAAARVVSWLSANGRSFYYQPALGRVPGAGLDVVDYPPADGLVLRVGDALDRPAGMWVKRVFDLCAASLALALAAPLLLALALLIRADGGPALYVQRRVGRGGHEFGCFKLRSMAVNAEARLQAILASDPARAAQWAAYQKLDDDPRVTGVGAMIRRFSLDELPQLINVLRGEMSLVGPRPMMPDQRQAYGDAIHAYERLRPGITGLWQVNGRNTTTFAERARLDAWYARNWSLWRDAVILARTALEIVRPSGR